MRGVAYAAKERGLEVTGTDEGAYPPGSDWLDKHRITWWKTPGKKHLEGVDRVIISGHIQPDHPELVEAQSKGIKVESFPEFIAELTKEARRIVIAGTHGKTTTTSLVTWLLESAGRKPDYLVGIKPHNFESSVRMDDSDVAVIEGDEYRASQLDTRSKFDYYRPDVLVVTSIEMDHPDFFTGIEDIKGRFKRLIQGIPSDGHLIYHQDDETVRSTVQQAAHHLATDGYGGIQAEWHAEDVDYHADGLSLTVWRGKTSQGRLTVPLYGRHNVLNSLAATAAVLSVGMTMAEVVSGAKDFKGASRRFERVTAPGAAVSVIDDYAHHPTEVSTTIDAAKLHFPGRVIAVFRPHTYSRIKELLNEYRQAFSEADTAFIAPIEGARETDTSETISGDDIARGAGEQVSYLAERPALVEAITGAVRPGDTVLCMTVNGYDNLAQELAVTQNKT